MIIVEIQALENGSHRNQTGIFTEIPEGWAVIPEDMEIPNFPFGEVKARKKKGVKTVTEWTAGVIPEVEEDTSPSEMEQMRAEIESLKAQIQTLLGTTTEGDESIGNTA